MGYLGDTVNTLKESAAAGPTNRDYPLCLVCTFAQANGRFPRLHCIPHPHPVTPCPRDGLFLPSRVHVYTIAPLHCLSLIQGLPVPYHGFRAFF